MYLKGALKGGDLEQALLRSIEIYTHSKDIEKLELHIRVYEEAQREKGEGNGFERGALLRVESANYLMKHNGMRYGVELIETVFEMIDRNQIQDNLELDKLKNEYLNSLYLFSFKSDEWRTRTLSLGSHTSD